MSHHIVQNYEIVKENGKQIIELSPIPLYIEGRDSEKICVKDYYADVIPLIENDEDISGNQKAQEYLDLIGKFSENRLKGRVEIYDENINVSAAPRTEDIRLKEKEKFNFEREFVWIDGAENTEGRIILPYDDYNIVYVAKGDKENPEIIEINEGQEGDVKPYYTKENGETIIYMDGFSGGGGTQSDPYLVSTPQDLDNVRYHISAYYEQTADIDMSSWSNFVPIGGTYSTAFQGVYNGNGYVIRNITITLVKGDYCGLFKFLSDGGKLTNIFIDNAYVSIDSDNEYQFAGILCGYQSYSDSEISNCFVSGEVQAPTCTYIGAICGRPFGGTIKNVGAIATVNGKDYVGGLFGKIDTNSDNEGSLSYAYSASIVNGTGSNVGGLAGGGDIGGFNCYWDTEVSGQTTSSAGIGKTTSEMKTQSTYVNWDFVNTWTMNTTHGYPGLQMNPDIGSGGGSDTTPPDEVTINTSSYTDNGDDTYNVDIQYTLPTSEDLDLIRVYRNGTQVDEYPANQTSSFINTVSNTGSYTYKITTIDTSGNESDGVEVLINITDGDDGGDDGDLFPTNGTMSLIVDGKKYDVKFVYLSNADGMPHPYARIITDNKVCVFKLKRVAGTMDYSDYPLRIITKGDIYIFDTKTTT